VWSICAADRLFTKIFISPHKLNREVFESVSQHPVLQKCVRELEYDGVYFSPRMTLSEYFSALVIQTGNTIWVSSATRLPMDNPDPQLGPFIEYASSLRYSRPGDHPIRLREEEFCTTSTFLQDGYQDYLSQASFQSQCHQDTKFLETFSNGLKDLRHLCTVSINDG